MNSEAALFFKESDETLAREIEARKRLIRHPSYFAGDLTALADIHAGFVEIFNRHVEKSGWPGFSNFSYEQAAKIAEMVRRCWTQPAFLRTTLIDAEQAFRFGEGGVDFFVQHYDTLMFLEGKPQVFGTVLFPVGTELIPWLTVEPETIEKRRAGFVLHPLKDEINYQTWRNTERGIEPLADLPAYLASHQDWARKIYQTV